MKPKSTALSERMSSGIISNTARAGPSPQPASQARSKNRTGSHGRFARCRSFVTPLSRLAGVRARVIGPRDQSFGRHALDLNVNVDRDLRDSTLIRQDRL